MNANNHPTSSAPLHIALACGGTGGHIFPGLATAEVLRASGHTVTLWLAGKDVESAAVSGWSGTVVTIPAQGLPTRFSLRFIPAVWSLLRAMRVCRKKMRTQPPDVLLAMGSYASVGPIYAALRGHVPVVLHEANVVPGRTIRLFSRWARAVAASFEASRFYLPHGRLVITGMPLRRELEVASRNFQRVTTAERFTVMVLGGSRGAHSLNEVASEALLALRADGVPIQVIHLTGPADETEIRATYERAAVPHTVHAFTTQMAELYAATDLAVCRSGASTCAELLAFGVPALLVPYPFAAANHQLANAQAMSRLGAADYVSEKNLSAAWLADYLAARYRAREKLASMSAVGHAHRECCGAEALAGLVEKTGRDHA
ncbi:MAG: UDP-N-acetylglucosamine--N-acetylmuramyl-(pentapeptide) pyrophosphoryl-undecaprenol N-acetylglucosamine transferase [Verrucomicrobia bacterium]|nr:MAG: UDP-N-acetylglucosamine--N-acetylmuramyl-(pentapeptide) pyrophosphoryl-undecaprenol N-acetylglucosamine transferase [Verrucomicrobiota bacterium]